MALAIHECCEGSVLVEQFCDGAPTGKDSMISASQNPGLGIAFSEQVAELTIALLMKLLKAERILASIHSRGITLGLSLNGRPSSLAEQHGLFLFDESQMLRPCATTPV